MVTQSIFEYSREVRIEAPLRTVWTHLSDLNYFLQFVPEVEEFDVDEDGTHAISTSHLVIGSLGIPVKMHFDLGQLVFEESVIFTCHVSTLHADLKAFLTMRPASENITVMRYDGRIVIDNKVLRRLKGITQARVEDHVDGFCSNAAVLISRHAEAENRLLRIEE